LKVSLGKIGTTAEQILKIQFPIVYGEPSLAQV